MGNYHPHGDSAIYDTLVRLAQPFSMRYPMVDGQGNFGNIDGYPPPRCATPKRAYPMAAEMLRDIDADTVDFVPNYDETKREPVSPPVPLPEPARQRRRDRRRNGDEHAAAQPRGGRGCAHRDDRRADDRRGAPDAGHQGPDFPTGGIILGREGIKRGVPAGRGRIVVRARAHIEELRGGKTAVIVSELPYTVKKSGDDGVIKKIAELVKDGTIPEVSDVNDHSDKSGMRIQIDIKRDAIPQVVLNKLFKHTPLQTTFGYNAVALVDGVPETLPHASRSRITSTSSARSSSAGPSTSCAEPRSGRTSSRATSRRSTTSTR